jgi:hypothetical protein
MPDHSLATWSGILALVLLAACASPTDPDPAAPGTLEVDEAEPSDLDAAVLPDSPETSWDARQMSRGQRLYVPIYSHIYFRTEEETINLAATVSIRNTDPDQPIVLSTIDYIDNDGALVRRYLQQPRRLGPLASTSVVIEESDAAGGLGANFIIEWSASQPVHAPVVESIMISTQSALGISFTSPARVLDERADE